MLPFHAPRACSSLQFHVTRGFLCLPCRALICKVSTLLCVCVVWFVVVESLLLIKPALAKLSLLCHIRVLLGSGAHRVNLFQALIVLKDWQTWRSLWPSCISLCPPLFLSRVSSSVARRRPLFLHSLPGSDTNKGM